MLYSPEPEGTYRLTQRFGERPAYYAKYGLRGHNGLDLAPLIRGRTDMYVFAPHEGYVKLGDEGPARVREAYPGPTWDRLVEVKRRWDPHNLFRRNQNIPPGPA